MSSGRKTVAINNPRHMIRTVYRRERGRESDGGPEERCHVGQGDSHAGLLFNQVCGDWIITISQPNWRRAKDKVFKEELFLIAQVWKVRLRDIKYYTMILCQSRIKHAVKILILSMRPCELKNDFVSDF